MQEPLRVLQGEGLRISLNGNLASCVDTLMTLWHRYDPRDSYLVGEVVIYPTTISPQTSTTAPAVPHGRIGWAS